MLAPFFVLAAVSPSRQGTFRRVLLAHLVVLTALSLALAAQGPRARPVLLGLILLTAGIVEGALLIGWRLSQLPKSQALEFLLVSPLQPPRVFLAEALVGLALLGLVTLSGLPLLALLVAVGHLDPLDVVVLTLSPFTWGAVTGLGLAVWASEPRTFRAVGEVVLIGLILVYLVVGVLAAENLRRWLEVFPDPVQLGCLRALRALHEYNPFGNLHGWLENGPAQAWRRAAALELAGVVLVLLLLFRGASRLQGHFRERHYEPVQDVSHQVRPPVGNRPLAWWAVKRVSEYSGRINLWLAGGFCLLYAVYLVGEAHWPAWLGRRIFQMCDAAGGPASLATALVVLAAVPASFQYGLWDSSTQDRCRRLELLLLTELAPRDYWDAAFAAAWRRGRGYFAVALLLWTAALAGGRLGPAAVAASVAAGVLLWSLYFALGFRAFTRGAQANGLGMTLTIGLPLAALALGRLGWPTVAGWLPPGMVYQAGASPSGLPWLIGPVLAAALTLAVSRHALAGCDAQLRRWYDSNHGHKVLS